MNRSPVATMVYIFGDGHSRLFAIVDRQWMTFQYGWRHRLSMAMLVEILQFINYNINIMATIKLAIITGFTRLENNNILSDFRHLQ